MTVPVVPAFESTRRTGRDNFYVRVVAKDDVRVELDVFRITRERGHGDFDFAKSFALQLIWIFPNLLAMESHPLADEVPFESLIEFDELESFSEAIIDEVKELSSRNYPLDENALAELSDDDFTAFWNDPANAPFVRFAITVSDAKWVAHLSAGLDYESPAFSRD